MGDAEAACAITSKEPTGARRPSRLPLPASASTSAASARSISHCGISLSATSTRLSSGSSTSANWPSCARACRARRLSTCAAAPSPISQVGKFNYFVVSRRRMPRSSTV
eukprot:11767935-Alexandrium_andersonii.AAC.1